MCSSRRHWGPPPLQGPSACNRRSDRSTREGELIHTPTPGTKTHTQAVVINYPLQKPTSTHFLNIMYLMLGLQLALQQSSRTKTASHQGFAVLVDEVFRGFGPFGQNNIINSFLGDLQATQIKAWTTAGTKHRGTGREEQGGREKKKWIREWI